MQALRVMWQASLRHCIKENSFILSSTLCNAIEKHYANSNNNEGVLNCYLDILAETISYKDGSYVDKRQILTVSTVFLLLVNQFV